MRKQDYTISHMYCTICKKEGIPIPRKKGREREKNHKKKLYCVHCKKATNHLEVRSFDY